MNKQLTGTGQQLISSSVTMKIKVAQSQLPIQRLYGGNDEMSKQLNYNNDERNPKFGINLVYSNEKKDKEQKQVIFEKKEMALLFSKLERIQDDLNSYT